MPNTTAPTSRMPVKVLAGMPSPVAWPAGDTAAGGTVSPAVPMPDDPIQADALAKGAAEALSYIGGAPFSRLTPRGAVDPAPGRRIVITPASAAGPDSRS